MAIKNAKQFPKVYLGLHMCEGVAEYAEKGKEPYRILIVENALKNMDPSYAGKPVYVQHVEEVDLSNIQNEADGYVLESFFNPPDGKHWVKFVVVSDEGHAAVARGWKLSNSYVPQSTTEGGEWHGVAYQNEITAGEYEHLAIVPNPRYTESVIMTPEEFKQYNDDKKLELERLRNSDDKKEKKMKFEFFKRAKVDNGIDEGMSVKLPKSKKEVTLEKLINDADKMAVDKNAGMADPEHKVKLHDGSYMNVAELVAKHKEMHDELEEMKAKKDDATEGESELEEETESVDVEGDDKSVDSAADEGEDDVAGGDEQMVSEADEDAGDGKEKLKPAGEDKEIEAAKKKKNAADAALAALLKKKNAKRSNATELEAARAKKAAAKEKADRIRNAHEQPELEEARVEVGADRAERGKALYGSN
jgi:hypothetical protein